MFGIERLKKRIDNLEKPKPIGEVYCVKREQFSVDNVNYCTYKSAELASGSDLYYLEFVSITRLNIEEEHNGYYKIFGVWHKKENVLFYDEVYQFRRDMIKKLNKEKK